MTTTIIPVAPSTSFFHTLGSDTQEGSVQGDSSSELPCDPWHVAGSGLFHANPSDAKLIQKAKDTLLLQHFPIRIGFTGYIDWLVSPFGQTGYTHDQTGRIVIALGDWWGFQRYVHGDMMVWFHQSDPGYVQCCSEEIRAQIWSRLKLASESKESQTVTL